MMNKVCNITLLHVCTLDFWSW